MVFHAIINHDIVYYKLRYLFSEKIYHLCNDSMKIDIVIARYKEDIRWINTIDKQFNIIVYNKGTPIKTKMNDNVLVRTIPNVGREAETYFRYLYEQYDNLPDATIFLQGHPFSHCDDVYGFINNVKDVMNTSDYQFVPFTNGWLHYENVPFPCVYNKLKIRLHESLPHCFIDIGSPRTLNSVIYHDKGINNIKDAYLRNHKLKHGTNIIHHFLSLAHIEHMIPIEEKTFVYFFAAQFCVKRDKILALPKEVYKTFMEVCMNDSNNAYIAERCWLLLFDGYDAPSIKHLLKPLY